MIYKLKRNIKKLLMWLTRIRLNSSPKLLFFSSKYSYLMKHLVSTYNVCILSPSFSLRMIWFYFKYGIGCYLNDEWRLRDFYEYSGTGIKSYNDEAKLDNAKRCVKEILQKECIGLIILTEDILPNSRVIIDGARELGVPTLTYMHGLYSPDKYYKFGCNSDFFWVWGEYYKRKYIEYGLLEPERLFVAGYPYEIPPNNDYKTDDIILFIGKGYTEWRYPELMIEYEKTTKQILSACRRAGYRIIFRPHPSEDIMLVRKRFKDFPEVTISKSDNLYKDVKKAKIVIGDDSTALLEAVFMNRIVVMIGNESQEDERYSYYLRNHIYNTEDIVNIIENRNIGKLEINMLNEKIVYIGNERVSRIISEIERIIRIE